MRLTTLALLTLVLTACTTIGQLHYVDKNGEAKTACETEYSGAPSVDKYAVEYVLSYCAKKAAKQGHSVNDQRLVELDLSIVPHPKQEKWTFENATTLYKKGQLTDKQYGYIIAYVDLAL